jgi:hypothetical protein
MYVVMTTEKTSIRVSKRTRSKFQNQKPDCLSYDEALEAMLDESAVEIVVTASEDKTG